MKNNFVTRHFAAEFRVDNTEKNRIIGRPIVFDQKTDLGWCEEVIERGALDNADLRDVLFFVNHDIDKIPLARSRNNNKNSTMQLSIGDDGVDTNILLDTENNSDARNLYSAISRGDITGMSFMFEIDGQEWEDLDSEKPFRRIKSISKVIEVSAVNFPAYPQTSITARDKTALESARAALDSVRQKSLDNDLELEKLKCEILFGR